jgi:hypothetical protein
MSTSTKPHSRRDVPAFAIGVVIGFLAPDSTRF